MHRPTLPAADDGADRADVTPAAAGDAGTAGDAVDAAIAALRDRGDHRIDPVRFAYIESLARRAIRHRGDARRVVDAKLHRAIADYGERVARVSGRPPVVVADRSRRGAGPGPLAELVRLLDASTSGPDRPAPPGSAAPAPQAARRELKAMRESRQTWTRLSVDRQLTRSLQQAPENPGPLNSHGLVLRSLKRLQEISPDYLDRFVAQVEALLWLEQAGERPSPVPARGAARRDADRARKPGRGKPG